MSEVNCKASPKYFFRNDALYVALTTTSTTTTTIAPPLTRAPVQVYERPRQRLRPLRRRRPQQDYYEDEYEDDEYVDTRPPARKRQPQVRARTRRPEYDDYGVGQGRRYSDERRNNRNRDPVYDEDEDEIDETVKPRNRNNAGRTKVDGTGRRYQGEDRDVQPQRPLANERRPIQKTRRKPNTQKPKPQRYDDEEDYAATDYEDRSRNQESEETVAKVIPSASGGSSLFNKPRAPPRINRPVPISAQKKFEYMPKPAATAASVAPLDEAEYEEDYEEPAAVPVKPVEPKRPLNRRPGLKKEALKPRVPLYEDELDDAEEPPQVAPQRNNYRPTAYRNTQIRPDNTAPLRTDNRSQPTEKYAEEEIDVEPAPALPRNNLRPTRNRPPLPHQQQHEEGRASQRRPVVENYSADEEEEVIIAPLDPQNGQRLHTPRGNGNRPLKHIQQDRASSGNSNKFRNSLRPNSNLATSTTSTTTTTTTSEKPLLSEDTYYEDEDYISEELPVTQPSPPLRPDTVSFKNKNHRFSSNPNKDLRISYLHSNNRQQESRDTYEASPVTVAPVADDVTSAEESDSTSNVREGGVRTMVRVIKRPFLPSRGGNPYLPRGLKPLGLSEQDSVEDSVGSEEPVNSDTFGFQTTNGQRPNPTRLEPSTTSTTTETNPRAKLEEILSSDLDVTLNDALNPTLKPLSRSSPIGFSFKYDHDQGYYEQPIDRSDAQPTQIRAIAAPFYQQQSRHSVAPSTVSASGPASDFYTDYEY